MELARVSFPETGAFEKKKREYFSSTLSPFAATKGISTRFTPRTDPQSCDGEVSEVLVQISNGSEKGVPD